MNPQIKTKKSMNVASIISKYKPLIFSILRKHNLNNVEIDDVAQEVFIKIYLNLDKYCPEKGALGSWIGTITKRTCIDHFRAKGYKLELVTKSLSDMVVEKPGVESSDSLINRKMNKTMIRKVLSFLSERQRIVLSLFYLEERTYKEMGEQLGIPYTRVGVEKLRAEKSMKDMIKQLGYSKCMFL